MKWGFLLRAAIFYAVFLTAAYLTAALAAWDIMWLSVEQEDGRGLLFVLVSLFAGLPGSLALAKK